MKILHETRLDTVSGGNFTSLSDLSKKLLECTESALFENDELRIAMRCSNEWLAVDAFRKNVLNFVDKLRLINQNCEDYASDIPTRQKLCRRLIRANRQAAASLLKVYGTDDFIA